MVAAQLDQELEKRRLLGDLMLVSNNKNVQGDIYIESEAEEIYLPDN